MRFFTFYRPFILIKMLYTYIQFANIQSTSNHNTTNTTISIIVNGVDGVASINPYLCAICFVMTSTPVGFPNRLAAVFPGKAININTAGIPTKGMSANRTGHPDQPRSCKRRTATATPGMINPMDKIKRTTSPKATPVVPDTGVTQLIAAHINNIMAIIN